MTYEQSREALAARVCGSETELARQVRELVASRGDSWQSQLVKTQAARRLVEDQIFDYLMTDMAQASPDRGECHRSCPRPTGSRPGLLHSPTIAFANLCCGGWQRDLALATHPRRTSTKKLCPDSVRLFAMFLMNLWRPSRVVPPPLPGNSGMAPWRASRPIMDCRPIHATCCCGLVMSAVVGGVHPGFGLRCWDR